MNPRETAIQAFQTRFSQAPRYVARAPGRVNLLGEHVGLQRWLRFAGRDRSGYLRRLFTVSHDRTTLVAADFGEEAQFTGATLAAKTQPDGSPLPEWAHYPAGTAWALGEGGTLHSGHAGGLLPPIFPVDQA